MIKIDELLSEEEINSLRYKKSWISVLTILSMWLQVALAFSLFILYPNLITFIISALIIASKQFQMVVLMHDGAHGLKKRKEFL